MMRDDMLHSLSRFGSTSESTWKGSSAGASSFGASVRVRPFPIEKSLGISFAAHLVVCLTLVWALEPRFQPRQRMRTIPITQVTLSAPPKIQKVERPKPNDTPTPPAPKPDPKKPGLIQPVKQEKPVVAKKDDPPKKPAEKTQPRNAPKDAPDAKPKAGAEESKNTSSSDRPAVGELKNGMQLQTQGPPVDNWYLELLQTKISNEWDPPTVPEAKSGELSGVIRFRVTRSGRVTDAFVDEPSGSTLFDIAALNAVQAASPFPQLPMEFKGEWLGIQLRFVYQE